MKYGKATLLGFAVLLAGAPAAFAQSAPAEKIIYNFRPATGQNPTNVLADADGNLYAATRSGGSNGRCPGGCGNILELSPSAQPKTLYTFPLSGGAARDPTPLRLLETCREISTRRRSSAATTISMVPSLRLPHRAAQEFSTVSREAKTAKLRSGG
jgi:hypothetical protein